MKKNSIKREKKEKTKTSKLNMTRRQTIKVIGASVFLGGVGCVESTSKANLSSNQPSPKWVQLLGTSEKGGRNYVPRVEGKLPSGLRGTLYRNGPGLFERGGVKLKHMLDGDGLVQRLNFSKDGVSYKNQFVRTAKIMSEEAVGKRLHSTWSTRKSENMFDNFGGGITKSQAGVTINPVHGKIIARDEVGPSYVVDDKTLETIETIPLPEKLQGTSVKAHSKIDPENNEWITLGTEFGRKMRVHVAIYEPTFKLKTNFSFESPRSVYIHDFIATKSHIVVVLHPCNFSPFPFLLGMKSFTDSLSWDGDAGNIVAVCPREGGVPKFYEAPGSFMWHSLNGYEIEDKIIIDFVGYDKPDHFIGENPLFETLMRGQLGNASSPGKIRRYSINLNQSRMTEEIIDTGNHEFPMIDDRSLMSQHQVGYFTTGALGALNGLNSGIKRFDFKTGNNETYDFGSKTVVGEPIFASNSTNKTDEGWLLTQCLDGVSGKSFFAVFDSNTVTKGPICKIWLNHHLPISFHGSWQNIT